MPDMNLKSIPMMKSALEQIQELHEPYFIGTESDGTPIYRCLSCIGGTYSGSCPTRKLADEALNPKPKPAIRHQCPNCKGVGKITHAGQIMPGRDFYTKKCLTCGGTGRMARTNQGENNA